MQCACRQEECAEGVGGGEGNGGGGGGGGDGVGMYSHPVPVGQTEHDAGETESNGFAMFPGVACDVDPPSTHITCKI